LTAGPSAPRARGVTSPASLRQPHTVTFDCWSTLIYEVPSPGTPAVRARIIADIVGVAEDAARAAMRVAWERHQMLWHRRVAFTGVDMTRLALEMLGASVEPSRERTLVDALEREVLDHEVRAIDGARDALGVLAAKGVRRALICDTGFTPGRMVRELLDRIGLLELLEVCIFSDEMGVPKPEPKVFEAALSALQAAPQGAVHVGDLRRSDVAGARAARMGSVRLRAHHDDADAAKGRAAGVIDCEAAGCDPACERPEADAVADSFADLLEILALD
jgi:putative hydrolase of the HAD superfamily